MCLWERQTESLYEFTHTEGCFSVRVAADGRLSASAPCLLTCTFLVVPWSLGCRILGIWLVVVSGEALALAGGHHSDFVGPSVAVGAVELDTLHAVVRWNATEVRRAAAPPLAPKNRVEHQVSRQTLAWTHKLIHWLGTTTRTISDVAGRAQLSAAQLRGFYTWTESKRENKLRAEIVLHLLLMKLLGNCGLFCYYKYWFHKKKKIVVQHN